MRRRRLSGNSNTETVSESPESRARQRDELRRRGLELQAAVPVPTGRAARRADKPTSDGAEVAGGIVDLALGFGLVGILLAIPGAIIWLLRRLQRFTDSLADDQPRASPAGPD
jgi:hypothetical protein